MHVLERTFTVDAPLEAVVAFHHDTRVLKQLTPFPILVQLRRLEPLAEGSRSEFTLWFGPFPVRWTAVHSRVDRLHGFTDTQEKGPLAFWRHTHRFEPVTSQTTRVIDTVEYAYPPGAAGIISRLLFNRPALLLLFAYRAWATRRGARRVG